MDKLNLSRLNGETISILTKSIQKQTKYWFSDTKKYLTDGKYVLGNNVLFNNDINNIHYNIRYYCICEYNGELYKTSFGNIINDMIMNINPDLSHHVLDVKVGVRMIDIVTNTPIPIVSSDGSLPSYDKTIITPSQMPLKIFQRNL